MWVDGVWKALFGGELAWALGTSLSRLGLGFAFGAPSGILCGCLLARLGKLRRLVAPLLWMTQAAPLLALLPALMLGFGAGGSARVALIALSCFLAVALYTLEAARAFKPAFVRLAANYGAGRLARLRRVYLPAVLPRIFAGLRVALTTGWVLAISSELVEPADGLGGVIMTAWRDATPGLLWLGVLVSGAAAVAFHAALRHCEGLLFPWARFERG